jgi:hypothetical protein
MKSHADLGGMPRVTDYGSWVQGVNAQSPSTRSATGARIPARAPRGLGDLIGIYPRGLPFPSGYGSRNNYPMTGPNLRLGPIPKLATGSGMTARQPGTAMGFTPGGYTPPHQITSAGMDMLPYLRDDFNAAMVVNADAPGGFPRYGVAATSGWEMQATYHPHDWVWADRFQKHGRSPGPWQQTSFPGYRALQHVVRPRGYNMYNNVALARPLSPNAYFLPWQTTSDVAARVGGGVNRPLGY